MALGPRLDLRQSQSLVMTPQLQQAIKLLALSNLELEAAVAEEVEKNPLLRTASIDGGPDSVPAAPAPSEPVAEAPADRLVAEGAAAADQPLDLDYGYHDDERAPPEAPWTEGGGSAEGFDFDRAPCPEGTLCDHLLAQAGMVFAGAELLVAGALIDGIDEAGYLTVPLPEVADRLGVAPATVERVLAGIQRFDPTGVGARSLGECLALQAKEADRYDPAMARLLDNLELLARGELPRLRRLCGVDEEDMADMIRELRGYDPKPGCRYDAAAGQAAAPVVPDVYVLPRKGGFAVELNSATLPRVLIDRAYGATLVAGAADEASRAWVSDQLAQANWLIRALDQRARTVVRVATELVKQQESFFRSGVSHLRPLTLRSVADAIGMHESTVSRVTSHKYLSCERGLFELKWFFGSGVGGGDAGGEAASATAVKDAIARLIGAEDPRATLSDDALLELLRAQGFDLARRTVAKYREAIGLGSSVQRRRAGMIRTAGGSAV